MAGSAATASSAIGGHQLAVFFDEIRFERPIEDRQHLFGRAAEFHALWSYHDRTVYEDRVRHHRVDKLVIGERRVIQPELGVGRALLPQEIARRDRSEEHTSELQSLMRISYAVFCLKKKKQTNRYM